MTGQDSATSALKEEGGGGLSLSGGFSGMINHLTFGLFKNSSTEKEDNKPAAATESIPSSPAKLLSNEKQD